jgi:hypothetical protein
MTESQIQQEIRIKLNHADTRAWRNNIAKLKVRGRWIDYGIPGKGGSDLIGLHTITIRPDHVGKRMAVFLAVECKSPTGKATPEQSNFIRYIQDAGGIAGVARSADEATNLIKDYER